MSSAGSCPYDKPLPKERLIRCLQQLFLDWNPGAPIGVIDWEGLADSTLTLAENLENFEKKYPVFKWRKPEEPEEERMREATLEEVRMSVEAALNAGYRPTDIAKMVREALEEQGVTERTIERTLSALNLPTGQPPPAQPQPAQTPPPSPPLQPPPAQTPPSSTSIQPRREVTEGDVLHAQRALEGWLWRSLRNEEYQRFEAECVARSRTVDELMNCAWRLYEEFSKRPIQVPRPAPAQPTQTQPQESARQVTAEGITDRRGMAIPFAGQRRRAPLQVPGYYPYMIAGCDKEGKVFVYELPTKDKMMGVLSTLKKYGRKILYYGLGGTEEGERWKSMDEQFSDECPREEEYGEGYA